MKTQKNIYEMTDRELRIYKRRLHRQRAIRRRIMMVFATICLIMVCAVSYHSIKSSANTGDEIFFKYYTSVTVSYGDTLWALADDYIDYNQYEDKETYLAEVKNINHLDENLNITAGQSLILPYYSNEFVK